jgi:hypothetical protein
MTTPATTEFPEIEWEMGDELEYDPEERMRIFNGSGIDKSGQKYSGSIYYVCGCFEEIKDIQLESQKDMK